MSDYITSVIDINNPTDKNVKQLYSYTMALEVYVIEIEKEDKKNFQLYGLGELLSKDARQTVSINKPSKIRPLKNGEFPKLDETFIAYKDEKGNICQGAIKDKNKQL